MNSFSLSCPMAPMIRHNFNITSGDNITFPSAQKEDTLVLQTNSGHKLLSLRPDVRKIYLEVTTLCSVTVEPVSASHPHIFSFIESLKKLNLQVELISNGSLLNDQCIDEPIRLGLDKLFISLDGPDETEYNDIRQGGDFASVTANISRLNERKAELKSKLLELAIEFVAMKKNFHRLPDLVKLIDTLGASYLLVTNVLPYSEELKDEILYDLNDSLPVFGNASILSTMRARMSQMKLRTERYCKFIEDNALTITWDGHVAPCYALMHSYTCYIYGRAKAMHPYHLGNITENTLSSIWQHPEYVYFRSLVRDYRFPSCTDSSGRTEIPLSPLRTGNPNQRSGQPLLIISLL